MGKIIKRIHLNMKGNFILYLRRFFVYLPLFILLTGSLIIPKIIEKLNDELINNIDFNISIGSILSNRDFSNNLSYEDYLNELEENYNLLIDLKDNTNYFDYNLSTQYKTPIYALEINEENIEFYALDKKTDINLIDNFKKYGVANINHLYGVYNNDFLAYHYKQLEIINGRNINEDELKGDNVCLVSDNSFLYADGNFSKIKINDQIPISVLYVKNDEVYSCLITNLTVVGTYNSDNIKYIKNIESMPIIMPLETLKMILEESFKVLKEEEIFYLIENNYKNLSAVPSFGVYEINSLSNLQDFIQDFYASDSFKDGKASISSSSIKDYIPLISTYNYLSSSFKLIFMIIGILLIIISIIFAYIDKNVRKKEIILLSSLGETDKKISLQLGLENFVVNIISILISLLILNIILPKIMILLLKDIIVDYHFYYLYVLLISIIVSIVISLIYYVLTYFFIHFKKSLR